MTLAFDLASLVVFARPLPEHDSTSLPSSPSLFDRARALRLDTVLAPLGDVPVHVPRVLHDQAVERVLLDRLQRRLKSERPEERSRRIQYDERMELERERHLRYADMPRLDMNRVFEKYGERLPMTWQRWLWWSHRCYEHALPRHVPALLEGIEALIAVEAQLHVDSQYPNRDHVLHQLADAELAVKLHLVATPGFDNRDWETLKEAVPAAAPLDQGTVTRCGLALAGMFHDIGYLRYVGASARTALASTFGLVVPGPSIDPWEVMATFAGTYLDRILWHPRDKSTDGLVADVFAFAWEAGWHGPLSAMVLASTARRLRHEGRATPKVEAALQIATAAAFLHELHALKPAHEAVPAVIAVARKRIAGYAWPVWFRIVDELQCWFRPTLAPCKKPEFERSMLDYGAAGARLEPAADGTSARLVVYAASEDARARIEGKEVKLLRTLAENQPDVFAALGITADPESRYQTRIVTETLPRP